MHSSIRKYIWSITVLLLTEHCYVQGTFIIAMHVVAHCILFTLQRKYCYYSHSANKEIKPYKQLPHTTNISSVLVLYCSHSKLSHSLGSYSGNKHLPPHTIARSGIHECVCGHFWWGTSHDVMVKRPTGVTSSEGLTGAGRTASKMVHYMAGELVLASGRKSGFQSMGLSRGCSNVLATSQLARFRVDHPRESKVENSMSL